MLKKNIPSLFVLLIALPLNSLASTHEIVVDFDLVAEGDPVMAGGPGSAFRDIISNLQSSLNAVSTKNDAQNTLLSLFSSLDNATGSQQSAFYQALSAKKNASSSNVSRKTPATITVSGIGKRMTALRKTHRSRFSSFTQTNNYNRFLSLQSETELSDGLLDQRLSGFFTGNIASAKQSETLTETGFEGVTKQLTIGADYRVNHQTFAGLAIGWVNGNMDMANDGGELKNNAATVSAYGSYNIKSNWYVDGAISTGKRFFDMSRSVTFTLPDPNNLANTITSSSMVNSEPESKYVGFSLSTGYNKNFSNGHSLAALASFNYSVSKIDKFCEGSCVNDPLVYSLVVNEQTITSKMLSIGGQWSQTISTGFGVLIPQLSVNLITELEDKSDEISAYFTNDPDKNTMSFKSGNKDLSFVNIKLAVSTVLPRGISGFIQYETQQFVDDYQQYTLSVGARKEF